MMLRLFPAAVILLLAATSSALAQQPAGESPIPIEEIQPVHESRPGGGEPEPLTNNPVRIPNVIEEAKSRKDTLFRTPEVDYLLQPWYNFKQELSTLYGFDVSLFYHMVYQKADTRDNESLVGTGADEAAGGVFQMVGQWELFGRGTNQPGFIGFQVQQRSRVGPVVPNNLGFEVGSLWPTQIAFSKLKLSVVELYWAQFLIKDRLGFAVGKQLPFAIHDYFGFKNPFDGFSNANFTLNPSIAFAPVGLSATVGVRPTPSTYIIAGIYDGNGELDRAGFDTFFDEQEYFTAIDIGWDPGNLDKSQAAYIGPFKVRDVHATFWHRDYLQNTEQPEGWGYTLFAEVQIGSIVPFFRYGKSEGTSLGNPALLDELIAGGIGITDVFGQNEDLIGIGLSWGKKELIPSGATEFVDLTGDGTVIVNFADIARELVRTEQYAAEMFYRVQLTNEIQITPNVQLIWDPILNVDEDFIAVFGIRGRAEL